MNLDMPVNSSSRIKSVDVLKGAIMILMAVDHVRVYASVPAWSMEPAFFFTRWITHFCAPGFVFFTGVSAFLYAQKVKSLNSLSRFLFFRGLLFILMELTIIRFFWTFNFSYEKFTLAGVIWMIGCCMVLMALLVRLKKPLVIGLIGLVIVLCQQKFSLFPQLFPAGSQETVGLFWEFVYPSGLKSFDGITILYVLVPWIGVMAAGYGFGVVLLKAEKTRNQLCYTIGTLCILFFLIVGSILVIENSNEKNDAPFVLQLLNQQKYPASILYLLMTLGPLIALIPFANSVTGWGARVLSTFGRVPMFYYLWHIPLIHISALLINTIRSGESYGALYFNAPYCWLGDDKQWPLWILYLVFLINVMLLYFICRWYAAYKLNHPDKRWLKYI